MYYNKIRPENYAYVRMGEMNELHYEPDILKQYGNDLKKTGNKSNITHYKVLDWISPTTCIELKTRTNTHNQYHTTMVGYNKVLEYFENIKQGKICYFLFGFLDGLFVWELTQENYDKIGGFDSVRPFNNFVMGNNYTTFNPNKLHLYIPIQELTKILDKGCLVPTELKKN